MLKNETSFISGFEGKYVTFMVKDEYYGLKVEQILLILGIMDITPIPKSPFFVKGKLQLRGKEIPIVDLRLKFRIPEKEYNEKTSIIILKIMHNEIELWLGIIIDEIHEVLRIFQSEIDINPIFGIEHRSEYISGVARIRNKSIILLDAQKLFNAPELAKIVSILHRSEPCSEMHL